MAKRQRKYSMSPKSEIAESRRIAFKLLYEGVDPKFAGNATACAIEVGYSKRTAHVQGCNMVKRLKLKEGANRRSLALVEKIAASNERMVEELERIALFDPRRLYHTNGRLKAMHEMDEDTARAIASFDVDVITAGRGRKVVGQTYKIRTNDKLVAIDKWMRMNGMFERDNRQRSEATEIQINFHTARPTEQTTDAAAGAKEVHPADVDWHR